MSTRPKLMPENGAQIHSSSDSTRIDAADVAGARHDRVARVSADREGGPEVVDEASLREAFLAHGGELYGFARRSLNSKESAEDVVQETFSRAWRSRSRFDATLGSLRTWLFTIERRVILDVSARQMKTKTFPLDQGKEPSSEDHLEKAMLGWQMESALKRLDPEHRLVVTELYFNGRSGKEVAELFGLAEGTVRSRAFYALRLLRLLMEEAGWDQ